MRPVRNASALALCAVSLCATLLLCGPARAEKRVALVVGNDRYANLSSDMQLVKAVNDSVAVGDQLAKLGFTVVRGRNLSRQALIDKLSEFTAQIETGDTAAFFYAGHGVAIGGVNYLVMSDVPAVTADSELRVRGASIPEGDIVSEIQSKGARVALLVLDACRDNPFPRTGTRSIGNTRGLSDAKPARGVFTIYSAGIGQTALDRLGRNDPNPNSVFTRVFVQALADQSVSLGDMVVDMREKVADLALTAKNDAGQPEPHEQTPAYYDQTIGGRIYLTGRPPAKPVSLPDPAPVAPKAREPEVAVVTPAPEAVAPKPPGTEQPGLLDRLFGSSRDKSAPPAPPVASQPPPAPATPPATEPALSSRTTASGRPVLDFSQDGSAPTSDRLIVQPSAAVAAPIGARPSTRLTASGRPVLEFDQDGSVPSDARPVDVRSVEAKPVDTRTLDARPSGRLTASGRPILDFKQD